MLDTSYEADKHVSL